MERWHVSEKFLFGRVAGCVSHVGRSVEYLAQSGVIASILKQQREEAQGTGSSVRCDGLKEWVSSVADPCLF